ncbi:hypothetical protein PSCICJ_11530 [Pseudomonas cichorii]|nr:hypothetical protein PSCICJ_11530 [Pseudomonas cichorii]
MIDWPGHPVVALVSSLDAGRGGGKKCLGVWDISGRRGDGSFTVSLFMDKDVARKGVSYL